ncbi:MAG: four helix bundle protein [Planctomycetota bacterium]|nr:four helix bundle protein [Planctomycetota bacterium]
MQFVAWTHELLANTPKTLSVQHQLERAAPRVPLNIAEGNGEHKTRYRFEYFDTARRSALTCAAFLDVLVAKEAHHEQESRPASRCYPIRSLC